MKICAIYIVWHDWDLLEKSVDNIRPCVDGVIIIGSRTSNFGNVSSIPVCWQNEELLEYEPDLRLSPHENETAKRNYGLQIAKTHGYDYFIIMDSDEFYLRDEFYQCKQYLIDNPKVNGIVHSLKVLFNKPTLWVNDHTLVPGIHKLSHNVQCGKFPQYPFAKDWDGNFHIDPTRRLNIFDNIKMSPVSMWHASWVRKDINVKIENSAARNNIKKSTIYKDLENADIGVYNEFYRDTLKKCDNYFNL
jgi:glycosyltransferase involved in cell wall biosynthesis